MAGSRSPYVLMQGLETRLNGMLSGMDVLALERPLQKIVLGLKQQLVDARLDIRDYELSETRDEQLRYARSSKQRLDDLKRAILSASEYNVFSAIDVAQLSAQLEQIYERLI